MSTELELEQRRRYYVMKRSVLFDREKIRDTSAHYPRLLISLADADAWGFEVKNYHNQEATAELIGGGVNNPAAAGLLGSSATIAANTREPIATDIWFPWLGLRVTYATVPTTGELEVTGWVQEVRR